MQRFRSYVLPFAIVVGLFFHHLCGLAKPLVPYFIFSILLLSFSPIKLKNLRFTRLDVWLMLFQIVVSMGLYYLLRWFGVGEIVSQGVLVGIICPVASSVVVIACMLGANRETVTAYTLVGNLMVAIMAPLYFSLLGVHPEIPVWASFLKILGKISPIIVLPFVLAIFTQYCMPKTNAFLVKYKGISFYIWAVTLCITIGQSIDFIFINGSEYTGTYIWLAVSSAIVCAVQFAVGKLIGRNYGDVIAGGQLLGQKNTALGIWLATTYLNPISCIFLACYSVWQNVFNSWQLWRHDHKKK